MYIYIYNMYKYNIYIINVIYTNETTETKSTQHDWLINYIPELVKKGWIVFEAKLRDFLKQKTDNYRKQTRVKNVYGRQNKQW